MKRVTQIAPIAAARRRVTAEAAGERLAEELQAGAVIIAL